MKTLHERVQDQPFEIERGARYSLSPIVGFGFGAMAFLFFFAGLLSTGQGTNEELALDPTPILILALLAGLAQNAFIGFVQRTARGRFSGAEQEQERPDRG